MPIVTIDGPPGLSVSSRRRLMRSIHAAVKEAYAIGETNIFVREHHRENVAINGEMPGPPSRRRYRLRDTKEN